MLAPDSVRVVRATADTVVRHGARITGRFYDRMFDAHPELLDLFNRGNQANGEQRQALAMSVAAVAGHFAGM
jgi:nitric oxide dioxygenase